MTEEQERKLTELTQVDPIYQDLLAQCLSIETAYQQILSSLPEADQEKLEKYISLCEELEHHPGGTLGSAQRNTLSSNSGPLIHPRGRHSWQKGRTFVLPSF